MRVPALLAILDGVGIREPSTDNAVTCANAPFLHELFSDDRFPCCQLVASGRDVGLPDCQMGNSEVGHLNIGAGRIVNQELTRIDLAIEDKSLLNNSELLAAFASAKDGGGTVHFMGLVSDGGVHSMLAHLQAIILMAAQNGCMRLRIHAFLDGRDVAPTSGSTYIKQLEDFCTQATAKHLGLDLRIGSVMGRFWAMDRDKRWERIKRAWRCIVVPYEPDVKDVFSTSSASFLVDESYAKGVTDEFMEPVAIGNDGLRDGDTVVFFNFRPDRARELTRALTDPDFGNYAFERSIFPKLHFVQMTEYDPIFASFGVRTAFAKSYLNNTLADYLASVKLRQLHIAETEKYAHVTFFLNGGVEAPKPNEQRILVPSPKVATYDQKPQMSAPEVTSALLEAIKTDAADVYIVNYANGDMVGHTGDFNAAKQAIEAVDKGLKQVVDSILAKGGVALITADHGNAEQMQDANGNPWTAHTTSPVPLALVVSQKEEYNVEKCNSRLMFDLRRDVNARLSDIAPTFVDLIGLPIPPEWTGKSLLVQSC
ncbi:MAG: 2,3-bisphosphoglycerate-independent phosphoglycerate mutase [Coriobacteriales bacterium]|nr:2,3-bisphosphoglycerate-independent phosphoglycerate mutase [Coriobacteriales bacterium]